MTPVGPHTEDESKAKVYKRMLEEQGCVIDEEGMAGLLRFLDTIAGAVKNRIIDENARLRAWRPKADIITTYGLDPSRRKLRQSVATEPRQ